ncbi:sugar ABC transporter substrate-binding protein [Bifidobacterium callitrichos]|uniref:Sugar ABC transporter substrate-binding protein n=1 Tax=Bifidobacterium callitrichos TaxID=762209 RepID=A0A5M9ZDR8_9BIFI|nr:sugar ABC transporter substrate-binding protein [Bifidobacterium callitrichos]KAA8817271.1 sugar ABC transporter substrate-binding protein [Bifidobacterium callitrichos]
MNTRTRVTALLAATAMIALSGCGTSQQQSADTEGEASGTVTVWAWEPALKPLVAKFEKKYPNITIKLTNVGTAPKTTSSFTNAFEAGSGMPDVVQFEYSTLPQIVYGYQGALENLSSYPISGWEDDYTSGPWSSVNVSDGIYGVPMDSGPMAMFYNKATFDKAGISEPPKTWDEFYEAAKKIHALGDNYYISSYGGDTNDSNSIVAFWAQAGAKPFAMDGENLTISLKNDETIKKVNDYWQRMIDEGLIATNIPSWSDEWFRSFADGTNAAVITGAWMPANLAGSSAAAAGDWRVTPTPVWPGAETINSSNGGSTLALAASSKNKKAAWKWLEFVSHDEEGIAAYTDAGGFPSNKARLEDEDFLKGSDELSKYFGGQEYNKVLAQSALDVKESFAFPPFWGYAMTAFGDEFGPVFQGGGKLDDAVAKWQSKLDDYGKQQGFTVKE